MALVVLLRGVNVGGHKTFRPSALAKELKHLGVVNIGAAGTFVVRKSVTQARVRAEFARRLPFDADIVLCEGRTFLAMEADNPLARESRRPDIVHLLSVLTKRPRLSPPTPIHFPSDGQWLLRIVARDDRFVFGMYRRHMKTIGYLGKLDQVFGVLATTRNWNTVTAIARVLAGPE